MWESVDNINENRTIKIQRGGSRIFKKIYTTVESRLKRRNGACFLIPRVRRPLPSQHLQNLASNLTQ